jgi:hypothetical protein
MVRYLFELNFYNRTLIAVKRYLSGTALSLILFSSPAAHALMGVDDAAANVKLFEILKTGHSALNQMTQTVSNLREMNAVLGNQIPAGLLGKLGQFSSFSSDLGGLMGGLMGDGTDPLSTLNGMGQQYGRSRDYSQFLAAKDYFKHKFFANTNQPLTLTHSSQIKTHREQAADEAIVSAIALSDQQVKGLQVEHAQLVEMSKNVGQSDTLNYQLNMQTRLMQKMVIMLERLIIIESKILDMQAKQYLRDQPVISMHKRGS